DVTPPRPDPPDVERVRRLAFEAALDMCWHEYAIESPFQVENRIHALMHEILDALGVPEGVRYYAPDDEAQP
ncbi:MAG TPA: hypothetical protein VIV12_25800, partial [Streptosporangiaceae bacterium]